jgi:hypothetical protein
LNLKFDILVSFQALAVTFNLFRYTKEVNDAKKAAEAEALAAAAAAAAWRAGAAGAPAAAGDGDGEPMDAGVSPGGEGQCPGSTSARVESPKPSGWAKLGSFTFGKKSPQ